MATRDMQRRRRSAYLAAFALLFLLPVAAFASFSRPLSFGSTGSDVTALQQFLKDRGFFPLQQVTSYFGPITRDALATFQASVGLEAVGRVGPKTLALLNGSSAVTIASSLSGRPLFLGAQGDDVAVLQRILKQQGFYAYPEITGYYGPATVAAVKAFQVAHDLEPVGYVGPLTRAKLAAIALGPIGGALSLSAPGATATTTATSTTPSRRGGGGGSGGGGSSDTTPPAAPTALSADAGYESVDLSWTDPADSDLSFVSVYRGTSSGSLSLIATTSPATETYSDTSLTNGTTYYYALSATDAAGNESARTSEESATPDSYVALASSLFSGTGRVAVWPDAANRGSALTGQIGSNRSAGEWGPLVGSPIYILGRELSAHTWLGYEVATRGASDDLFINHTSQSIYKPAKFVRWDAGTAVADNGSGGSAAIPIDASGTNTIRFRLNTLDTQVTDLALAIVYLNNNINKLATVTISGASSGSVTPNLVHTAAQAVADGWLSSSALVSNGGTIADAAYVLATNVTGRQHVGNTGFQSVPLAADLSPDDYTVTVTVTTIGTNGESSATSRAYIGGLFYRDANTSETTTGATMARMGYVSGGNDGSANETFYLNGKPVAGGSNREIGKAHGNETRTQEPTLLVDGDAYRMSGNSSTRARTSNVATIKTALPHGLTTGDVVTMSGFGSSSYSANEVAVTVVDSTTFTYPKTGADEAETADTAGRFIRTGIKLGSSSVQLSEPSALYHQDYLSGGTPIGDLTTTYTLAGKTFTTEAEGTLDIAFRHAGSFGVLASYWSKDPTTYGPVYPGALTAKAHQPEQAEEPLDNDDGSAVFSGNGWGGYGSGVYVGKSLAFALSRPSADMAHIVEITSLVGNDTFGDDWTTFVQDRDTGGLEKLYLMFRDDLGTKDTPAGWSFDYATERIDGIATDATDSGIFTD